VVLADISTSYFRDASKKYPERVINVGIMEQTAVSLASGLALEGFHPIVHSITPFVVERPFEQIKDDFCYQGVGGTFISIGASYDYGTDGMTHHGSADVPILKTLPRMQICVPGTADEFEVLLLMSDGETTAGTPNADGIEAALEADVPVSTIAFGTDNGTITIPEEPFPVPVRVDEVALEEIADTTGGTFFRAVTADQLNDVYADIGTSVGFVTEQREVTIWFVGAALVLLLVTASFSMLWFSRLP
jgi:hypothetical protein